MESQLTPQDISAVPLSEDAFVKYQYVPGTFWILFDPKERIILHTLADTESEAFFKFIDGNPALKIEVALAALKDFSNTVARWQSSVFTIDYAPVDSYAIVIEHLKADGFKAEIVKIQQKFICKQMPTLEIDVVDEECLTN